MGEISIGVASDDEVVLDMGAQEKSSSLGSGIVVMLMVEGRE